MRTEVKSGFVGICLKTSGLDVSQMAFSVFPSFREMVSLLFTLRVCFLLRINAVCMKGMWLIQILK